MLVVRLFHFTGLFECCFREPVERIQSSECRFENTEHKKLKNCTEITKNQN